jgi:hypothetical protein
MGLGQRAGGNLPYERKERGKQKEGKFGSTINLESQEAWCSK